MKVVVDLNRCQGYGQCVYAAPNIFQLKGPEILAYDPAPPEQWRDEVERAAHVCPVRAIRAEVDSPLVDPTSTERDAAGLADQSFASPSRIVVAGASLAGLSAAETLRDLGYHGDLVLIGDEPHPPYDRPPLSKQVLTRRLSTDTSLPQPRDLNIDWRLGAAARGIDLIAGRIELANGGALDYDRFLIATGTRARPWPKPDEASVDGVLTLWGRDDAERLTQRLAASPGRVVIIGGGFIGCELASCCREMGLAVTIVESESVPMRRALGQRIGAFMATVIRDYGVDLRLGAAVERIEAGDASTVGAVILRDGTRIDTDLVIVALGAQRNVEWLEGSGLLTSSRGLRCDAFCRALKGDGSPAPGVFAAGDVAHCAVFWTPARTRR